MVTTRRNTNLSKRERIAEHVEVLKAAIQSSFPEAEFEFGAVPDSKWPGLWVHVNVDDSYELFNVVDDEQERFFLAEGMYVWVINLGPRNGAAD